MSADKPLLEENIIILDDAGLYRRAVRYWKSTYGRTRGVAQNTAHNLCESRCFEWGGQLWNFMYVKEANAHPMGYLTVGHRATLGIVRSVLAIGSAYSLDGSTAAAGQLRWVEKAVAVSYPALFENRHPDDSVEQGATVYDALSLASIAMDGLLPAGTVDVIQRRVARSITVGYTRHPVENGSLRPWHREQLERLGATGVSHWSELPCGVFEGAVLLPATASVLVTVVDRGAFRVPERGRKFTVSKYQEDWETVRLLIDGLVAGA